MRFLSSFDSSTFNVESFTSRDYATGGRHLNMRGWIVVLAVSLASVAPIGFFAF